ncbi:MAG: membrane-bound lytic murein transglycosylase MltF [Desulfobacteraceae bacterium]|nr:membrane-bound lytic murein transglycosylase MltF [Desulfobacteraceae bacterium]
MKRFYQTYFIPLILILLLFLFTVFSILIHNRNLGSEVTALERIKQTGVLRLITDNSIHTYYYYNGRPTGFEYELAVAFADFLHVDLDVVAPGWNNMFTALEEGKGDFIASGLVITREGLEKVNYSIPYMTIQQHVIYHHLDTGPEKIEDLASLTLHVNRETTYHHRLNEIKASGVPLNYILYHNIPAEELIRMVHDKEIRYTIAANTIAVMSQKYYPDIRIGIPIREKEALAWAVSKKDPEMLEQINKFFLYAAQIGLIQRITDKYFSNIQNSDPFDLKKFHQRIETRLPEYLSLIHKEAEKYGLDWKLIAAIVYQESQFDAKAVSLNNVKGLMQVTSIAAEEMGLSNLVNPSESIKAGIQYFDKMIKKFEHIDDDHERIPFALASYNVGYGHVSDAVRIAEEMGLDSGKWQNLKKTLPLLSKPGYYTRVRYGYARGLESVQYVERILTYYDILKQKEMD